MKEIIGFTGTGGAFSFDTEMIIAVTPDLTEQFRKTRDKLYGTQQKLNKIESNKIYKILKFLKLI